MHAISFIVVILFGVFMILKRNVAAKLHIKLQAEIFKYKYTEKQKRQMPYVFSIFGVLLIITGSLALVGLGE